MESRLDRATADTGVCHLMALLSLRVGTDCTHILTSIYCWKISFYFVAFLQVLITSRLRRLKRSPSKTKVTDDECQITKPVQ